MSSTRSRSSREATVARHRREPHTPYQHRASVIIVRIEDEKEENNE